MAAAAVGSAAERRKSVTFSDVPGEPSKPRQQSGLRKGFLDAPKPVLKKVSSFDEPETRAEARRQEEDAAQREEQLARVEDGRQAAFSGNVVERTVGPAHKTPNGVNGGSSDGMQPSAEAGSAVAGVGRMPAMPERQTQESTPTKKVSRFKQQRAGL